MIKLILQKIVPKPIFSIYHFLLAQIANIYYGGPSSKMIVVGITGTKGKTSAANFIWSVLEENGIKAGIISTANVRIGKEEMINPYHMTMPGRFKIQKFLKEMLDKGVKVAIVETTSQGLAQYRHIGIQYDFAIFTNLFAEHIESHGSFENYKKAKGVLFKYLTGFSNKTIDGKKVKKTIIVNSDSEHAKYYEGFKADKKITFSVLGQSEFKAEDIEDKHGEVSFSVDREKYKINISGKFNIYNALPAVVIGKELDLSNEQIKKGLDALKVIPGRMEEINEGQGFKVFVDYAHEKESLKNALLACRNIAGGSLNEKGKVIVIIGAEGGGRDKSKGPQMGAVAGEFADMVVVSTTDPYDDDPKILAEAIAVECEKKGKNRDENLFVVLDRREGIHKALSLASTGDVVLTTAMGAQQNMIVARGKKLWWDERVVVREELRKLLA
jgi:UDP-N-acetylmuramoyl-L-alanyl-D-glutamate--2,6-diaminopimelate ligase